MKKLFVFGADGLIGNKIVEQAKNEECGIKYDIIPLSHRDIDISNRNEVLGLSTAKNIDSILVNCAVINSNNRTSIDVKATNVGGVYNLADLASNLDAKLVHISSDYVFWNKPNYTFYGDSFMYSEYGSKAVTTDDEISHVMTTGNRYADSKINAEKVLSKKPCKMFIVRTSWVYGDGKNSAPDNFVSYVIRKLLTKQAVEINTIQVGVPTPATYLAKGILRELPKKGSHIAHIAGSHIESRFTWAVKIARYLNKFENQSSFSYEDMVRFSHSNEKQQLVPICTILNNSYGTPIHNGTEEKDMKALYNQIKEEQ